MRVSFLGFFLASCCILPASAAPRPVVVEAGKPGVIYQIAHLDPKDCKLKPAGAVQMEAPPQNGKAEVKLAEATGKNSKCGEVRGKIIRVHYAPKPGYKGPDQVEFVLVVEPDQSKSGARERRSYRIPIEVR